MDVLNGHKDSYLMVYIRSLKNGGDVSAKMYLERLTVITDLIDDLANSCLNIQIVIRLNCLVGTLIKWLAIQKCT